MSDIVQRLGFDASSAISQIKSLQSALSGLNASLNSTAAGIKNFNKASANMAGGWRKTRTQVKSTHDALTKFGTTQRTIASAKEISPVSGKASTNIKQLNSQIGKLDKKTMGLTISWETLARVVTTRLAIGAVNRVIQALIEGTKAAIEFGIQIAEIGTIAGKTTNLDSLRDKLIEVSSVTGKDLSDVAEGFYQTLSNQVGNASESLFVFQKAAELSVATSSSLGDSVNLLTAALNGWQLASSDADTVASKLFKTIELGRVRVGELSNILGAVGPMSSTLGISLEELLGSFANMTVQGTRSTKTITQLRAVMTQMLKPTDALKTLMNEEWGVSNARQAIAKFGGMTEVILELHKVSGGASDQMAEFFSNVRALTGVFATTANIDKTTKALNGLSEGTEGLIKWASKLVLDSPAKKAQLAFNNLKISVVEVGRSLIPLATVGAKGLNLLVRFTGTLTAGLIAIPFGLVLMNFGKLNALLNISTLNAIRFSAALKGVGLAAAFMIGWEIGKWISGANERFKALIKTMGDVQQKIADEITNSMSRANDASDKERKKDLKAVANYLAAKQVLYNKALVEAKKLATASVEIAEKELGKLVALQQQLVDKLAKVGAESQRTIESNQLNSTNIRQELEQKYFDWNIENQSVLRKAWAKTDRAKELIARGRRALEKDNITEKEIEAARKLIELGKGQAEGASQEASSIKDARQSRVMLLATRKQEVVAAYALIAADKRSNQMADVRAKNAKIEYSKQLDRLKEMKSLIETITKGVSIFDEDTGEEKPSGEKVIDRRAARKAMKDLQALMGEEEMLKVLTVGDFFDASKLSRDLISQAKTLPILEIKFETNYNKQKAQIEAISRQQPIELIAFLKIKGFEVDAKSTPAEINEAMIQMSDKATQASKKLLKLKSSMIGIQRQSENLTQMKPTKKSWVEYGNEQLTKFIKDYKQLNKEMPQIRALTFKPGSEDFKIFQDYYERFAKLNVDYEKLLERKPGEGIHIGIERIVGRALDEEGMKKSTLVLDMMAEKVKELVQADPGGTMFAQWTDDILSADAALDMMKRRAEEAKQEGSGAILEGVLKVSNTVATMKPTALITGMTAAETKANSIASTLNSIKPIQITTSVAAVSAPPIQKRARGGLIKYYGAGGFAPRGTDTVAAMLTPGEFVVNAKSTRKFYSQLVAMNSGSQPTYKAVGGPVTNNNIGDINVTVEGGQSNVQSAREIATALRREMRRNTLSLN